LPQNRLLFSTLNDIAKGDILWVLEDEDEEQQEFPEILDVIGIIEEMADDDDWLTETVKRIWGTDPDDPIIEEAIARLDMHEVLSVDEKEYLVGRIKDEWKGEIIEMLKSAGKIRPATVKDYFADALDVEYRINQRGELTGAQITIGMGGPNVWVTTDRGGEVFGKWGNSECMAGLDGDTRADIVDWADEQYEVVRLGNA
jgi:hypothetical protein